MAVYNLAEMARRETHNLRRGVLNAFGEAAPILDVVPIQSISGNSYTYTTRTTLAGVAFRGINESFTPTKGAVNPQTESLRIAGGEIDLDTYLVDTQGDRTVGDLMATEILSQGMAMGKFLTKAFFKGDSASDPREFDGLQRRLVGQQLIAQGGTSGGDALTLAKLDELLDAVVGGADAIFCNKTVRRKINSLMRAAGQAQEPVSGEFGRQYMAYAGKPIIEVEDDHEGNDILAFNEANPGGGTAATTSIYAVKFGADQYVSMLQNSRGMIVTNLGMLQSDPKYRVRVQWYLSLAVFHGRSAARLWGIKNA